VADPFLGEIRVFPYNFAPRGWAVCDGQLLPISQNTALFSLLGTQYGGNGIQSFALPNLQGRVAIGAGQGPGLSPRFQGDSGGSESVPLFVDNLPPHAHVLPGSSNQTTDRPAGNAPAVGGSYGPRDTTMAPSGFAGGGVPVPTMPPYLTFTICIAMAGIFPARN
jgi:microcystin-dependent protein